MSKLIHRTYSTRTFDSAIFVIKKEWNVLEATDVYRLYNEHETYTDGFTRPSKSLHYISQGNLEWAKKTAEHYKIKIEEKQLWKIKH
jgi:hypothetical protein